MTYIPTQCPPVESVDELRRWVEAEFNRLTQGFAVVDNVVFNVLFAAPAGPVAGMVVFADGTTWNPGSGRGLYEFRVASWVKL